MIIQTKIHLNLGTTHLQNNNNNKNHYISEKREEIRCKFIFCRIYLYLGTSKPINIKNKKIKKESMKHKTTFFLLTELKFFERNRLKSVYSAAKLKKQSINRLITGEHTT